MSALKMYYEKITLDWEGKLYCGITMKWNYAKSYVQILIPLYINKALHKSGHKTPKKPQNFPYSSPEQTYGADAQK